MQLLKLITFILLGLGIARVANIQGLEDAGWYLLVVSSLLAIGLYASTYGIDLREARKHLKIIASAVTIGVLMKAAIVGGSLTLLFGDPYFLILGVIIAQIDPLSVANLMGGDRMSAKAKTILASWASFDDPITVILSLYAPLLVAQLTGADLDSVAGDLDTSGNLIAYAQTLGFNLLLACSALGLWLVIRRYAHRARGWLAFALTTSVYVVLAAAFSLSILHFLMLGIALIGLFLRPPKIEQYMGRAISWALLAAALMLGFLLVGGIDFWKGIALGTVAYIAQIIVGALLTRGLPKKDRWHIALAQQNGITAIILALLFEPSHPGTVAIIAPAIVTINGLHWFMNRAVDIKLRQTTVKLPT